MEAKEEEDEIDELVRLRKTIEEQAATIEKLKRENESLREQIEEQDSHTGVPTEVLRKSKIRDTRKDFRAENKDEMTFSNQLIIEPLPESPFSDADMKYLHNLLTVRLAKEITDTAVSCRALARAGGLPTALRNFSKDLGASCVSEPNGDAVSATITTTTKQSVAPGSLRLAEEAQTLLSGSLLQVCDILERDFDALATKYGDRARTFVSIEVMRLREMFDEIETLRNTRDSKGKAILESAGKGASRKSATPRKKKIANQRNSEVIRARQMLESARFRYLRRANHIAIAAANDVTQRSVELASLLRGCFEDAAGVLARVESELHRVRELTMNAVVSAVSDDAIWIGRCENLKTIFEEVTSDGHDSQERSHDLPLWSDDRVYVRPPRRHCRLMRLRDGSVPLMMGWLLKVASSQHLAFSRASRWRRRWFWIDGDTGRLCYAKHRSREIIDLCDLAITTARRCESKPHSFELVSPTFNGGVPFLLQAETASALEQWLRALQRTTSLLLARGTLDRTETPSTNRSRFASRADSPTKRSAGATLVNAKTTCADCSRAVPEWASINLGILLCIDCAGVHRTLGVGVSQVRSLLLDDDCWDRPTMSIMTGIGNENSNRVWSATLGDDTSGGAIRPNATRAQREVHIRDKYVKRRWIDRSSPSTKSSNEQLREAASRGDLVEVLRQRALGGDVTSHDAATGDTALHLAARAGSLSCVAFLLRNGASERAVNIRGVSAFASLRRSVCDVAMEDILRPSTPGL